ncbi:hypothetical protein BO78DRAFT_391429 [Aspergillus sclerotiicarbonarius CBS 121057]|uniref:Zn(2)-C6 fungal-type domain-containing protein n=1 Tax=Aspergillus sclerotiicarbonarius (strain CBS 121057 / IBT 28362) TaxID=1448318 RepID=A0A319DTK4_ASPSB|nr:hypothetical protein BO78DRAFT_391429 [Aspergillus sclerotiicarbonarius CBS 121057]
MTTKRTSNQAGLGNDVTRPPKRAVKAPEPVQDDNPDPPQPDAVAEDTLEADIATDKDETLWPLLGGMEPTGLTPQFALPEYSPGELDSITSPLPNASEVKQANPASADLRNPDPSGEHATVVEGASASKGATRKDASAGDYVPTGDGAPVENQGIKGVAGNPDINEPQQEEEEEEEEGEETTANTKKKRGRPKLKGDKSSGKVGRPRQTARDYSEQVQQKYRQKYAEATANKKPNRTNNACDRCKARRGTCDKNPECCNACKTAKVECKMTDPNTLEVWPRGACRKFKRQVAGLEDLVRQLKYAFHGSQHRVQLLENQLHAAGLVPVQPSHSTPPMPMPMPMPTSVASAPRHHKTPSPYQVGQLTYPDFPNALQANPMPAAPLSNRRTSAPQDSWPAPAYAGYYSLAPPQQQQLTGYNPQQEQSPAQRATQHGPSSSRRNSRSIQPQQPRRRQQQQQQQQPAAPSPLQYHPGRGQPSSQATSVGINNVPSFDHNLNLEAFGLNPAAAAAAAAAHPSLNPSLAQAMFTFPTNGNGQPIYPATPGPLDPAANFAGVNMPGLEHVDTSMGVDYSQFLNDLTDGDFNTYIGASDPNFNGAIDNAFDAAAPPPPMPGSTPGPNPTYPNGNISRRASHSASSSRGMRVHIMTPKEIILEDEAEDKVDDNDCVEIAKPDPLVHEDSAEHAEE